MSDERRERTASVLAHLETYLPVIPDVPGKWDDVAKVAVSGILKGVILLLAAGQSPEEIAADMRKRAANPTPGLGLDDLGDAAKARIRGEREGES